MKLSKERAKAAGEYFTFAIHPQSPDKPRKQAIQFVQQFLLDCCNQLPPENKAIDPRKELDGKDIMIYENGRDNPSFRCECGGNVFRKTKLGKYKCNNCSTLYSGEPKEERVQSRPGGVSTLGYHPGGALPTQDDPLE